MICVIAVVAAAVIVVVFVIPVVAVAAITGAIRTRRLIVVVSRDIIIMERCRRIEATFEEGFLTPLQIGVNRHGWCGDCGVEG